MLGPPWTTPTPAAYLRTSPPPRPDDEPDLGEQRRLIERYVEAHELEEPDWYVDEDAAGDDLERVGLRRLMTQAQDGEVSTVLVAQSNRLSTRLADVLAFIERYLEPSDATLVSVTERFDTGTGRGRDFLGMLRSFSSLAAPRSSNSDDGGEEADRPRPSDRRWQKAEAGEHVTGRIPFGYRQAESGRLRPDPDEAPTVRRIFRLRRGGKSLRAIAKRLNDDAIPAPSGGSWRASSVRYLLDNETYYGYRTYTIDGETVTQDVPHLQIVDTDG
jgi:DNA invertase Pin-like site-specific DNA recombinase